MKYETGDSLRINIRGVSANICANLNPEGNVMPIRLYEIDPDDDGRPRYMAEEALDFIVQMGADVYHETLVGETCDDGLVEIGDVAPGTTVLVGGMEVEVLDDVYPVAGSVTEGIFCLAKDILFSKEFDEDGCNNWAKSSLRKYLNGEYRDNLIEKIGEGALLPFERDLTSDDGMTDYCDDCVDKISLISCDEYRTYRRFISNKSDWWWTLTPWSCRASNSHYARYVCGDGSLGYSNAYCGDYGVSPAFVFLPSLRVKIVDDKED